MLGMLPSAEMQMCQLCKLREGLWRGGAEAAEGAGESSWMDSAREEGSQKLGS